MLSKEDLLKSNYENKIIKRILTRIYSSLKSYLFFKKGIFIHNKNNKRRRRCVIDIYTSMLKFKGI